MCQKGPIVQVVTKGDKVFDDEQQAVQQLMNIINTSKLLFYKLLYFQKKI